MQILRRRARFRCGRAPPVALARAERKLPSRMSDSSPVGVQIADARQEYWQMSFKTQSCPQSDGRQDHADADHHNRPQAYGHGQAQGLNVLARRDTQMTLMLTSASYPRPSNCLGEAPVWAMSRRELVN